MFRGYRSELAILLPHLISSLPVEELLDFVSRFIGIDIPVRLRNTLLVLPGDLKCAFALSQKEICKRGTKDDIEKLIAYWKMAVPVKQEGQDILQECLIILSQREVDGKVLLSCALLKQKNQIHDSVQSLIKNFLKNSLTYKTRYNIVTLSLLIDWDCIDIPMDAIAVEIAETLPIFRELNNSIGEWGNAISAFASLSQYIQTSQIKKVVPIILDIIFRSRVSKERGTFVTALESLRKLSSQFGRNNILTFDVLDELLVCYEDNEIGLSAHTEIVCTLKQFIPCYNTYQINTIIRKSYANIYAFYTASHLQIVAELSNVADNTQIKMILNKIKLHLKDSRVKYGSEISIILKNLSHRLDENQINDMFLSINEVVDLESYCLAMRGLSSRLNNAQVNLIIKKVFEEHGTQNELNYFGPFHLFIDLSPRLNRQQLADIFVIINNIIHTQESNAGKFSAACYGLRCLKEQFNDAKIDLRTVIARLYSLRGHRDISSKSIDTLCGLSSYLNNEQLKGVLNTLLIQLQEGHMCFFEWQNLEQLIPSLNNDQIILIFNIFLETIDHGFDLHKEMLSCVLKKMLFSLNGEHVEKLTNALMARWSRGEKDHLCPILDVLSPCLISEKRIAIFILLCDDVNFDGFNTSVITRCLTSQLKLLIHAKPDAIEKIKQHLIENHGQPDVKKASLLLFLETLPQSNPVIEARKGVSV